MEKSRLHHFPCSFHLSCYFERVASSIATKSERAQKSYTAKKHFLHIFFCFSESNKNIDFSKTKGNICLPDSWCPHQFRFLPPHRWRTSSSSSASFWPLFPSPFPCHVSPFQPCAPSFCPDLHDPSCGPQIFKFCEFL